jgi:hypothetical protein
MRNLPIWLRVPAIIAAVLGAIVISTTFLSAAGVGSHGSDAGHGVEMTDRMSSGSGHGSDASHSSGGSMPRMDHSTGGTGHGSSIGTAVPK